MHWREASFGIFRSSAVAFDSVSSIVRNASSWGTFSNREQLKVTRSEIQRVRWLGDDRNAFLGEELLHKWCVARCVIMMQKPHGTNFALTSLIFKSLDKIAWMDPWEMPASCSNSTMVILRSYWNSCRTFSIRGIPGTFWLPYIPGYILGSSFFHQNLEKGGTCNFVRKDLYFSKINNFKISEHDTLCRWPDFNGYIRRWSTNNGTPLEPYSKKI